MSHHFPTTTATTRTKTLIIKSKDVRVGVALLGREGAGGQPGAVAVSDPADDAAVGADGADLGGVGGRGRRDGVRLVVVVPEVALRVDAPVDGVAAFDDLSC